MKNVTAIWGFLQGRNIRGAALNASRRAPVKALHAPPGRSGPAAASQPSLLTWANTRREEPRQPPDLFRPLPSLLKREWLPWSRRF